MRPGLFDVLFPRVRAEILRLLFFDATKERYVREIARRSDLALRTVQKELEMLKRYELVTWRSNGFHVFFRANRKHPAFPLLQVLVVKLGVKSTPRRKSKTPKQRWRNSAKPVAPRMRSFPGLGRWYNPID